MTQSTQLTYIRMMHAELTNTLDDATSRYFLTQSAQIAYEQLESPELAYLTPNDDEYYIMLTELTIDQIESSCSFLPLPHAYEQLNLNAQFALSYTYLTSLTYFFITNNFRQIPDLLDYLETLAIDETR